MSFFLDLTDVPESKGFNTIPPGKYYVVVDDALVKETKAGTGSYINVKYKILEGEQDGRFIFGTFNIRNQNPKAVEIGLAQLRDFMRCAGRTEFKLTDVLDLIGLRCDAVVKIQKSEEYGDKAIISYFKAHEGAAPEVNGDIPF